MEEIKVNVVERRSLDSNGNGQNDGGMNFTE
jgi:hypothetical protein